MKNMIGLWAVLMMVAQPGFTETLKKDERYTKVVLEKISFKSDARLGYYDVGLKGDIVIQQGCNAEARKYDMRLIALLENGTERLVFQGKGKDFFTWNPPPAHDQFLLNGSIPRQEGAALRSSMQIAIDRVAKTLEKSQSGPHFIPFKAQIVEDVQIERLCRADER